MAEGETPDLMRSWSAMSEELGRRFSESLRNAAVLQREMFYRAVDVLDTTRGGPGQPPVEKVANFEEVYRTWIDFSEKAGRRVSDAFVGSIPERTAFFKSMAPNGMFSPLDGKEPERLAKDLEVLKSFFEEAMKLIAGSAEPGKTMKPVSPETTKRLVQLWVESVMKSTETFLRSEAFTRAQGQILESALELRKKMDTDITTVIEKVGLPTRSELDEVYRRLTSISREVFDLKRAMLIQNQKPHEPAPLKEKEG